MEIGCIIQARMGSTRLPGKVLEELEEGKTCLDSVIQQLEDVFDKKNIVIATTNLEEDKIIEQFCKEREINVFKGETKNVLDRYYKCAKEFDMQNIVRVTSDCPLIDPGIVFELIKKMNTGEFDYVSNVLKRTFPIGLDAEIFTFYALEQSWKMSELPSEREHVTPFIKKNSNIFKQYNLENNENKSDIRVTLDMPEDLMLIRKVVSKIKNRPIRYNDLEKLFEKEPEILSINKNIKHDGYERSLNDDRDFILSDENNG
ncbi:MAG: acylneuraminate cytidylyltransferase [Nitrospina sp.]|nr:acylneuraminate cytidylyltransferase [Nitrospina sp.]|tara:strand:+ start:1762 stop:2538 length:777 start_codon:yes stop_codon:yes gene_type:complete